MKYKYIWCAKRLLLNIKIIYAAFFFYIQPISTCEVYTHRTKYTMNTMYSARCHFFFSLLFMIFILFARPFSLLLARSSEIQFFFFIFLKHVCNMLRLCNILRLLQCLVKVVCFVVFFSLRCHSGTPRLEKRR